MKRGPNAAGLSDISYELACELGLRPWADCPLLDCQPNEPPAFLNSPHEIADWHRSKGIRGELQAAIRQRKKAAREPPPEAPPT
jgi:hypothetical protein